MTSKVTVISNKGNGGIYVSHEIICQYLKNFIDVRHVTFKDKINFIDLITTDVLIGSVHSWHIILLRFFLFKKNVLVCHGFPQKEYYPLYKYFILIILLYTTNFFASKTILVGKNLRRKLFNRSLIFNNLDKSYEYNIYSNNKKFIFFGRICAAKGINQIIDILKEYEGIKLYMYGEIDKKFNNTFKKIVRNNSWVEYCGSYKSLNQIKENSGYFISLNWKEPFGIVYSEALSLGLIPLVPIQSGFKDVFDNKDYLISNDNVKEKILSIINRKNSFQKISLVINDDRHTLIDWIKNCI